MVPFRFIVSALTVALLTLPSGVMAFDAVLCIKADGHVELEERGCDCTASHTPDWTAGQVLGPSRVATNFADAGCVLCIEIPVHDETGKFRVQSVVTRTELFLLDFAGATRSGARYPMASRAPLSNSYHGSPHMTGVGSIPLRV